jgi:hypothetical protein
MAPGRLADPSLAAYSGIIGLPGSRTNHDGRSLANRSRYDAAAGSMSAADRLADAEVVTLIVEDRRVEAGIELGEDGLRRSARCGRP